MLAMFVASARYQKRSLKGLMYAHTQAYTRFGYRRQDMLVVSAAGCRSVASDKGCRTSLCKEETTTRRVCEASHQVTHVVDVTSKAFAGRQLGSP